MLAIVYFVSYSILIAKGLLFANIAQISSKASDGRRGFYEKGNRRWFHSC